MTRLRHRLGVCECESGWVCVCVCVVSVWVAAARDSLLCPPVTAVSSATPIRPHPLTIAEPSPQSFCSSHLIMLSEAASINAYSTTPAGHLASAQL